jgi:hypothetical protein
VGMAPQRFYVLLPSQSQAVARIFEPGTSFVLRLGVCWRAAGTNGVGKAMLGLQLNSQFLPITDMSPQQSEITFGPVVKC